MKVLVLCAPVAWSHAAASGNLLRSTCQRWVDGSRQRQARASTIGKSQQRSRWRAGVPRLLGSTATGGSVQAALWNAVCKHDLKVGLVSMCGVKCVLKLC